MYLKFLSLVLICAIAVISSSCDAQFVPKNTLEESNIKEDVSKIVEQRFNADSLEKPFLTEELVFNEEGNLTSKKGIKEEKVLYLDKYSYDAEGRCKSSKFYMPEDVLNWEYTYEYDSSSYTVLSRSYRGWFAPDGSDINKRTYSFDRNKVLIELVEEDMHNGTKRKYEYSMDAKTRKRTIQIFTTQLSSDNKKLKRLGESVEVLDSLGNTIESSGVNNSQPETYMYKYDKQGNWIEKQFFKKGKLAMIYKRTITYR